MNTRLRIRTYNKPIPRILVIHHLQDDIRGNTHKELRMCKGTKHKYQFTQAQRRDAQSPEESGPKQVENKPITKANHLNSTPNPHGPRHKTHGRQPTKDGRVWTQPGCGRTPPTSPNSPISRGLPLIDIPKVVPCVWSRFNVLGGRFGGSMRGSWNIPCIFTPLSTIKEGLHPLLKQHTKEESYIKFEHHSKGLRP